MMQETIFNAIVDCAPYIITVIDPDGTIRYLNRTVTGIDTKPFIGRNLFEIISPEYHETTQEAIRKACSDGQSQYYFNSAKIASSLEFFENQVSLLSGGKSDKNLVIFSISITRRKKAEESLQESEFRYRQLVEHSPDAIVIHCEGRIAYINPAGIRLLGARNAEEIIGRSAIEYVHSEDREKVGSRIVEAMHKGIIAPTMEERFLLPDDRVIDVEVTGIPLTYNGKPAMQVIVHDITNRKKTNEDLKQSELKFRTIFETALEGIFQSTSEGRYLNVNPSFARILGYDSPEDLINTVTDIGEQVYVDPLQRKEFISLLREKKIITGYEAQLYRKDKSRIWSLFSAAEITSSTGKVLYYQGGIVDITAWKKTEENLKESREKIQSLFQAVPTGVGVVVNSIFIEVNPRVCEITGYTRQDLLGQNIRMVFPSSEEFDQVGNLKYDQIAEQGSETIETRWRKKDGSLVDILLSSTPIAVQDPSQGMIFSALDITDRKRAEEALRLKNHIFDVSIVANSVTGLDGKITDANNTFIQQWGYPDKNAVIGKHILEFMKDPSDSASIVASLNSTGQWKGEFIAKRMDGTTYISHGLATVIRDKSGNVTGYQSSLLDVTDRYRTQSALEKSEQRFRSLFENIAEGVAHHEIVYDSGGKAMNYRIINVNPAFEIHTGLRKESVLGKLATDAYGSSAAPYLDIFSRVAETGNPASFEIFYKPLGKYFSISVSSPDKGLFVTIFQDITTRKNTEKQLQESEERFRSLYENASIGLYRTTPSGNILLANPTILRILGFSSFEELAERDLEQNEFSPDYPRSRFKKLLEKENEVVGLEGSWIRKDGTPVAIRESARAIRNEHGEILFYDGTIEDITERKMAEEALRESEERYRTFMNSTDDMAFIKDSNFRYIMANVAMQSFFGKSENEILGKTDLELLPEDLALNSLSSERHALEEMRIVVNLEQSGELLYESRKFPVMLQNGEQGVGGFIRDVTRQKQAERDLVTAREKAEQSDRLKSAFLANMSHEIRTPMNAIVGFSGMLSDPDLSADDRNRFTGIIQSRSEDLMHLINDLLEISRIESGNISLVREGLSLNAVVDEMESVFRERLSRTKKLHLYLTTKKSLTDKQSVIQTDGFILRQVFSNLLDNAIKYTDKGSIHFGYYPPEKDRITFFVSDTGIGIEPEYHAVIFEHFRQAEIKDPHKYGGTGLGLSICKGSLALLGGDIRVESEPGHGSTFLFTIPYTPESGTESPCNPVSTKEITDGKHNWRGKRLLLVEDEPTNMEFLKIILERTGADLVTAYSGTELKSYYNQLETFDLVLLDVRLPDAVGWDLAAEIKKIRPSLPVIAQTAYAMSTDKKKSEEAGCDGYLSKPIRKSALFEIISRHLD